LSKNKIQHLDGDTFKVLTNLTTLYLAQNQIQKIDGNLFKNNLKLATLNLASNQIHSVDQSAFENRTHLNSLDFSNNPCAHYSCQNCSSNFAEFGKCYGNYNFEPSTSISAMILLLSFFIGPHSFAKYFFPPNFSLAFWKRKIWREKIYSSKE
jgi:hypothetical protein